MTGALCVTLMKNVASIFHTVNHDCAILHNVIVDHVIVSERKIFYVARRQEDGQGSVTRSKCRRVSSALEPTLELAAFFISM